VAIDDEGTPAADSSPVKPALIAELTWAQLYTRAMHKELVAISTAINKSEPNTAGPEMKKSAEKLRDQLQGANHTVNELSDYAGLRPGLSKK